jgi:hypothetical protein
MVIIIMVTGEMLMLNFIPVINNNYWQTKTLNRTHIFHKTYRSYERFYRQKLKINVSKARCFCIHFSENHTLKMFKTSVTRCRYR